MAAVPTLRRCSVETESGVEPVHQMPDDETSPADKSGSRAANRAELLDKAILRMEEKLGSADVKATFGDFIKLLQLQKEMQIDQPREIKVTWIEPSETESASEE
jgi:hypothetical protein